METSLIFVIIVMFYFCIIFPLQMRRYIQKRQRRLLSQRPDAFNNLSHTVPYSNRNRNGGQSSEQSDNHIVFANLQTSESRTDDEVAAARYLEAEHRQQIIDIQRKIEQQAVRRQESSINSSTINDPAAEHRQQIIDIQREIEQQAIQRNEESQAHLNALHMPPRLINSSTVRSSIYTITSGSVVGASNSNINYPYGPPLTPDGDVVTHIGFPVRPKSKDDELPSYDQAVAFDSTTASVTISRY